MIRIKHKASSDVKIVTKGAYENLYESLGYEIFKDENKPLKKEVENKEVIKEVFNEEPKKIEIKGEREKFSRK